jgi:dienelactone hydrolase
MPARVKGDGMKTRELDYKDGDLACRGFLAEPEGEGRRPAILVVHEAPGLTEHPKRRARMLADELGFVALAADMYGGGAPPIMGPGTMERMQPLLEDRQTLRRRALAGIEALKALPNVDPDRIAAIGYCFGGSTVLELARGGVSLRGVSSFHGGLKTPTPAAEGAVKTPVLICTGSEDPTIPLEDRNAAQAEFTRGGADWQMIVYSGAKHAFTNAECPDIPGFGYDPKNDRRSWEHLKDFFAEILA